MHVQSKLSKWGNSLGLRITGLLKTIPHFTENMLVDIEINEKGLFIKPSPLNRRKKLLFSEAELLQGLTKKTAHADELAIISNKELGS